MLKQDFREAMESQVDPQGQLAQALAMARQQGPDYRNLKQCLKTHVKQPYRLNLLVMQL
jgi:hypothetical protein